MGCHLLQGREQPPGRVCALAAKPLLGVNGHSTAGSADGVCPFSFRRHSEIPRRMAPLMLPQVSPWRKIPQIISQKKILHVFLRHPFWHQHIATSGLIILATLAVVTPENTGAQSSPKENEGKLSIQHHMASSPHSATKHHSFPFQHDWIVPGALNCSLDMCDTCLLLAFQGNMRWDSNCLDMVHTFFKFEMPAFEHLVRWILTKLLFLAPFSPYFPCHPKKALNSSTFSSTILYITFDKLVLQNHPQFFQTMQTTPC